MTADTCIEVTIHHQRMTLRHHGQTVTVEWSDAVERVFTLAEQDSKAMQLCHAVSDAAMGDDPAWLDMTLDALQARLDEIGETHDHGG